MPFRWRDKRKDEGIVKSGEEAKKVWNGFKTKKCRFIVSKAAIWQRVDHPSWKAPLFSNMNSLVNRINNSTSNYYIEKDVLTVYQMMPNMLYFLGSIAGIGSTPIRRSFGAFCCVYGSINYRTHLYLMSLNRYGKRIDPYENWSWLI